MKHDPVIKYGSFARGNNKMFKSNVEKKPQNLFYLFVLGDSDF